MIVVWIFGLLKRDLYWAGKFQSRIDLIQKYSKVLQRSDYKNLYFCSNDNENPEDSITVAYCLI